MSLIHHESLIDWPFAQAIGDPLVLPGIEVPVSLGAPALAMSLLLAVGIDVPVSLGPPLILPSANIVVFIGGVDRSRSVELQGGPNRGIQRSLRIAGGSKGTCEFVINNSKTALYRPQQGEEVLIHYRMGNGSQRSDVYDRFFAGFVDKVSEIDYTGSKGFARLTVYCGDYGSLLDRVMVGRVVQAQVGNDPTIITKNITDRYFARFGIQYQFTGFIENSEVGDMTFNWLTGSEAMNRIVQTGNGDWRVDFWKTLFIFTAGGYKPAPFSIEQNDGNWMSMTVDVDNSRYRNRIGVKTTQNNAALWTDSFTVAAGEFLWITMAPLESKPIVLVDGVPARVVDFNQIGSQPYDFYWINTSVITNPASPPSAGTVLTIQYPSPISFVVWAEDQDEIDAHGMFEGIETVPDLSSVDEMEAHAQSLLARRLIRPTTLTIVTDRDGLEPGQSLVVNTTRPQASGTFLITDVSSAEQGKSFFRHTVKAIDTASQLADDKAFERAVINATQRPRDRVFEHMVFQIAETIEGFTNPGLTTGLKNAIRTAPKDGVGYTCSLLFNQTAAERTTRDCIIDVLQNGVSIFPPVEVPTQPTAGESATAGVITAGDHLVFTTFVSGDGESGYSPTATFTASGGKRLNVTNIQVGPSGTLARNVYMTAAGVTDFGEGHLLATISDNVTDELLNVSVDDDALVLNESPHPNKLIWPAGTDATFFGSRVLVAMFRPAPLIIRAGEPFTVKVLLADPVAHDGTIDMSMLVS